MLLCWLALLLVRLVEIETGRSWERLRDELTEMCRVDLRAKDGAFQVVTNSTAEQGNILKLLDIHPPKKVCKAHLEAPAA